MTQNTKTSPRSRFKLNFDGQRNIWYVQDTKFNDNIELTSNRDESTLLCSRLNSGSGFDSWQIPTFLHKSA
jgi:hypothetical protein